MTTNNDWNAADGASVADGSTGMITGTAYAVLCGGTTTTAPQQNIASVGTSGQVLTSNGAGALPTMQTPAAGGGGWVLIETQDITSAVATVDFEEVFDSTYNFYIIVVNNLSLAVDSQTIYYRVGIGGATPSYPSTGVYNWNSSGSGATADTEVELTPALRNGTAADGPGFACYMVVNRPSDTSLTTFINWRGSMTANVNRVENFLGASEYDATTAVTGIRFLNSSGNFDAGSFSVYGVSKT